MNYSVVVTNNQRRVGRIHLRPVSGRFPGSRSARVFGVSTLNSTLAASFVARFKRGSRAMADGMSLTFPGLADLLAEVRVPRVAFSIDKEMR
jgi:hypothetical protein